MRFLSARISRWRAWLGRACCTAALAWGSPLAAPWSVENGLRFQPVTPQGEAPGFRRLAAPRTGVAFTNVLSERTVALNRVTENGSGLALGDVDGDGLCDVYICGLERDNALYRNLGDWKFEEIAAKAGVACTNELSTGAAFADIDADGDLDLLVTSIGGGTRAFLNDGHALFTELTQSRLVKRFGAMSMALGDLDGDGDLDLYVTNYRTIVARDELPAVRASVRVANGQLVVAPPNRFVAYRWPNGMANVFELPERDFMYVNLGGGNFAPAAWTNGNFFEASGDLLDKVPLDWGLSVMIRDINGDLRPDLLVCNDFFHSPDRIWINRGGGSFRQASNREFSKVSLASMAVDVADINRDGHDDLFFVEMLPRDPQYRQSHRDNLAKADMNEALRAALGNRPYRPEIPRNTLFLNRGNGTYAEIAEFAGVDASDWSWSAIFLDVDLDGYEDLLIASGHNHDVQDADVLRELSRSRSADTLEQRIENLSKFKRLAIAPAAFRNAGGLAFTEQAAAWGLAEPGVANAMALGDLDGDGDLDLVMNMLNEGVRLYENRAPGPRLAIRLRGTPENRAGIGARITVAGGPVRQSQTMIAGGRYLSSDDTMRVFAAKDAQTPLAVTVDWPNGESRRYEGLLPNRIYELAIDAGTKVPEATALPPKPLFSDATTTLAAAHRASPPSDFEAQPLLPWKLRALGPGLTWADVDQDGDDDLLVPADVSTSLHVRRNDGGTNFATAKSTSWKPSALPQQAVAVVRTGSAPPDILATESAFDRPGQTSVVRMLTQNTSLPAPTPSALGAMAIADVDADGELDLFCGGRAIPGTYPHAASSTLFRYREGGWVLDETASIPFRDLGLVSSAVFADLNNDGFPELVLACEWGPIRIFTNTRGSLQESTRDFGLHTKTGWWNSIAAGDFDGDGRTDLVAGNWGQNSKYSRQFDKPLRIWFGDFAGRGAVDIIEAFHSESLGKYVPREDWETLSRTLPFIAESAKSFADFSRLGVEEILGPRAATAGVLEVATLDSMVLLNRGDHFLPLPLPAQAQFTPVFGIGVGDFDGDDRQDLVLAQNLFDTRWSTGPLDAGVGLLLRGKGDGYFEPLSVLESGIDCGGQQRGVAVTDYDADGRLDMAIAQHGNVVKLFHNESARPGIRVRLEGSGHNPDAIGASFVTMAQGQSSPRQEIRLGSGHWSQDGFVKIMPTATEPTTITVTWPGGETTSSSMPPGARDIVIAPTGEVRVRN